MSKNKDVFIKVETHCHTKYSHDSVLEINAIVDMCLRIKLNGIVICDHDVYGLKQDEEKLFSDNKIILYKGIEFTTHEGIHIIGISENIKKYEKAKGSYLLIDLVTKLKADNCIVIIPHPMHETGLLGNKNVKQNDVISTIKRADYYEKENFKYGQIQDYAFFMNINPDIKAVVGSDSHSKKVIGAFFNEGILSNTNVLVLSDIIHVKRLNHTKIYWKLKRFQKSKFYQVMLHLFSERFRKRVKRIILILQK